MSIYIRRVGEVADGSVTEIKLAEGAVTETKIGDAAVTETKLADDAIVAGKIKNLEVTTDKLSAQAVTLAKADTALLIHHFAGDETEVSVTGVTEVETKTMQYAKGSDPTKAFVGTKLHIISEIKTNNADYTGTFNVYLNGNEVPDLTLTTASLTYEIKSGEIDISGLGNGKHVVHLKMKSSNAAGICYNDLFEFFVEK